MRRGVALRLRAPATAPPAWRPPPRCPARRPPPPSLSLLSDGAPLSSLLDGLLAVGVVGGVALSALPLLTGASERRVGAERETRAAAADAADFRDDDDEEDLQWGVASVVACIPLLGWTAWIFAGLNDAKRAPLYYAFAALYAVAAAKHGLQLDAGALAVAAACGVHMQVERAARVEAVRLPPPGPAAARAVRTVARGAADAAAGVAGAVEEAVREGLEEGDGEGGGDGDAARFLPAGDAPDYDAALLRSFDERLREREREKEGAEQEE